MNNYYAICVVRSPDLLTALRAQLQEHLQNFCEVRFAESVDEAMTLYHSLLDEGKHIWLMMSEHHLDGQTGDAVLAEVHERDRYLITVLITRHHDAESSGISVNHAGLSYLLEYPWTQKNFAHVLDNVKTHYEKIAILNEMNLKFASSIDQGETLNTVFYNILHVIQAEAGSIFLFDEFDQEQKTLICRICQGPKDLKGLKIPIEKGIVGYVARTGNIDVTQDVKSRDIHAKDVDKQTGFLTRSMVSVPLIYQKQVIGVIQVINKQGGRIFSADDIALLQSLSSGAALAIKNAQYAQRLLQEERIRSELLIAHQIQQGILPEPFAGHPDIHFEAKNLPAKGVGGDFYDYLQFDEHTFTFFIGDVCGKGIPAAIFMASSHSTFRSQALSNPHPANVIPLTNLLIGQYAKGSLFVTAFYGMYNTKTGLLNYTNAGHMPGLLYRPSTATCSSLCNANLPLGMFPGGEFHDAECQLEKGDVLILYTDGINEAVNSDNEEFGTERLVNLILQYGARPPQDLQQIVLDHVKDFSAGQEQRDDITIMIVTV